MIWRTFTSPGYIESSRLAELLATGDVHVVPLRAGLGRVSVPSKTYSIMAAGRPVIAAIDPGTAVPSILEASGGGVSVAPDDPEAFIDAVRELVENPSIGRGLGALGRRWVVREASPAAVGAAYDELVRSLGSVGARPPKGPRRR